MICSIAKFEVDLDHQLKLCMDDTHPANSVEDADGNTLYVGKAGRWKFSAKISAWIYSYTCSRI